MSGYTEQVTRELLAVTQTLTAMERTRIRLMLSDAWAVGYEAGRDDPAGAGELAAANPFVEGPSAVSRR